MTAPISAERLAEMRERAVKESCAADVLADDVLADDVLELLSEVERLRAERDAYRSRATKFEEDWRVADADAELWQRRAEHAYRVRDA